MSDELRENARRLARWSECTSYQVASLETVQAVAKLAEAYLAEHPEDDDEPATDDWVESIAPRYWEAGQEYYWPQFGLRYATKIGDNGSAETEMWYFDKQTINGKPIPLRIKTRGDVRRLLAALGIEIRK